MNYNPNTKEIKENISIKLSRSLGCTTEEATKEQIYKATAMTIRDLLSEKRVDFRNKVNEEGGKRVYYMCMEFLVGRSLKTNLGNLAEMRIHVDDDIFYLFSVLETTEIPDHICLFTVRKNVYDPSVPGIGQDRLVLLSAGVAFEFIDGQHLRKFLARIVDQVKIAESR